MKKYKRKGLVQGQARNTATVKAEGGRGTDAQPAYYFAYVCEVCEMPCYFIVKKEQGDWLHIFSKTCQLFPSFNKPNWQRLKRFTSSAVAILQKRYRKDK